MNLFFVDSIRKNNLNHHLELQNGLLFRLNVSYKFNVISVIFPLLINYY